MSGSMWQGMETRFTRPRRHSLTLLVDGWIRTVKLALFVALGFVCFMGESVTIQPPVPLPPSGNFGRVLRDPLRGRCRKPLGSGSHKAKKDHCM
jgi:hypothetical protein